MKFGINKSFWLNRENGQINLLVLDWLWLEDAKYFGLCILGVYLSVTWIADEV